MLSVKGRVKTNHNHQDFLSMISSPSQLPPKPESSLIRPRGTASVKYAYKMASICGMFIFIIVIIIAGSVLGSTNQKFGDWIETTGEITNVLSCSSSNDDLHTPEVTFDTMDGIEVISSPKSTCTTGDYVIGDPLDIVYNPDDPEQIQTQRFVDAIQITAIVFVSIGCFCCCFSSLSYCYFLNVKRPGIPDTRIDELKA